MLAIMVRDVRDVTFSSLDCLWSLETALILSRASRLQELMIQRYGLDTNAIQQWFELAAGTTCDLTSGSDMFDHICSKSATPW